MYSIIVVPPTTERAECTGQLRLAPGEKLSFGRSTAHNDLSITHDGVSRAAGEIAATGTFWTLTNLSRGQTYVVENPEGAGEHIKVGPGRVDAPVPFEFARVVLPAGHELLSFDVWAPRHDYLPDGASGEGAATAPAFPLDRAKRYFLVLTALCAPRLSGDPHAPLPTTDEVADRLRARWPAANRTSVQWNIDYLAVKLRLKPGPDETPAGGPRLNGKKETLVSLALRFDLVREEDLELLGTGNGPR
ncbi:FHA domain-containing protein [Streptomyces sp. NPDC058001]|uniref:FHA domain-containing protein n=1 Tax=Streptomyces sp. NPDC058001 TaxID=3346300 RepID=UPI0036E681BC